MWISIVNSILLVCFILIFILFLIIFFSLHFKFPQIKFKMFIWTVLVCSFLFFVRSTKIHSISLIKFKKKIKTFSFLFVNNFIPLFFGSLLMELLYNGQTRGIVLPFLYSLLLYLINIILKINLIDRIKKKQTIGLISFSVKARSY